jgi:IS1 family transposase
VLELDEVWSFVGEKAKQSWLWTALCRRTRQIVAFVLGHREETEAWKLREAIPPAYQPSISYSDLYAPYETVFDYDRHRCVPKQEGQTNHMERWNNTLRQRMGRFVRKTLSFSKSESMHEAALRCFIYDYNLSIS